MTSSAVFLCLWGVGAGDHLQTQRMLYAHVVKAIWAGQPSSFLSTVLPPGSHQHFPLWRSHLLQVNCSLLFSESSTNTDTQRFESYFPARKRRSLFGIEYKINVNKAMSQFYFYLTFLPDSQSSSNKFSSKSLTEKDNRLAGSDNSAGCYVYLHMSQCFLRWVIHLISETIFTVVGRNVSSRLTDWNTRQ